MTDYKTYRIDLDWPHFENDQRTDDDDEDDDDNDDELFCGMVDWQKAFSLISSRDHCQRS